MNFTFETVSGVLVWPESEPLGENAVLRKVVIETESGPKLLGNIFVSPMMLYTLNKYKGQPLSMQLVHGKFRKSIELPIVISAVKTPDGLVVDSESIANESKRMRTSLHMKYAKLLPIAVLLCILFIGIPIVAAIAWTMLRPINVLTKEQVDAEISKAGFGRVRAEAPSLIA